MRRREFMGSMGGILGGIAIGTSFGSASVEGVTQTFAQASGMSPTEAARDEGLWRDVQSAFTIDRSIINLDNGNVCPSPRAVTEEMVRRTWEAENSPAFVYYRRMGQLWQLETVRTDLARQFGCNREELAIMRNATEALDSVLLGIELKAGDEVVVSAHEYWAMMDALEQRTERDGIVLRKVPVPVPAASLDVLAQGFERLLTKRTKLVLVSHPVNLTGQMFPIKQICDAAHAQGAEVVVDGAQSFAHVDYKLADLGCDYFGTSLHKWLLAPVGTGMLYVRRDKIGKVRPLIPAPADKRERVVKFEHVGTQPLAMSLGISEALAFHNAIGGKRKEERLRHLTRYWAERVRDMPNVRFYTSFAPGMSCGLATFDVAGVDSVQLAEYLQAGHRIIVQPMNPRRVPEVAGIRVTPNLYTTLGELDRFCEVIEQVTRKGLPKSSVATDRLD
jgi:isopenicillin-N epimerase